MRGKVVVMERSLGKIRQRSRASCQEEIESGSIYFHPRSDTELYVIPSKQPSFAAYFSLAGDVGEED